MIDVVINYNPSKKEYILYEASSDTMIVTANLGEMFIKLNEFLGTLGFEGIDILQTDLVNYHLDSYTFQAIMGSNIGLLKRLSTAQSGFINSENRFGQSTNQGNTGGNFKAAGKTGSFSKSSFKQSNKKFGNKN